MTTQSGREPAAQQHSAPHSDPGPRTVLVVDDEEAIAHLVADALEEEGYEVRVKHDGASALLDIVQDPPDLVLLDIAMPVMVGDELLRYLRRNGFPHLPVIVMTAGLRPESYLADGASAVVAKPFDLNRLIDLVGQSLEPPRAHAAGA
jgi:CheY-like chemotaxis protein